MAQNKFPLPFFLIILLAISGVVIFLYTSTTSQQSNSADHLLPTTVNGVSYLTTGVIPPEDEGGRLALRELIALSRKKQIILTNTFRFSYKLNNIFQVELFPPHAQNKQVFIDWLRDNGYSHINPEQFIYINLP